jgi:uncharacterized protein
MSREAIEVVQALGDAYFRGDVEAMLELVDPDVVVNQFPDQPDAQPYLGHEGMLQAMSGWVETWDDYAIEAVEAKDFGDNILVALRQRGRGKASGVELEADVYFVYSVQGGKVVRWQMFPDEGEAIRAAEVVGSALMPQNLEIVREAFLAASGGDPAAGVAAWDPAIEWDMSGVIGWTEKRVYRGREVLEFLREWAASWRDWHFDVDEVRAAGDEQVFAAIHERGTGVESAASVDQRRYFAIDLSGGLIVRVRMFSERADALEALGPAD